MWHWRSNATESAPTKVDRISSAPESRISLDQRREVAGAERPEPLADDRATGRGQHPAGRGVCESRPAVVVAGQEPARRTRSTHQRSRRGPDLVGRPFPELDAQLAAQPTLVRQGMNQEHAGPAQPRRERGECRRGRGRQDGPAAGSHQSLRLRDADVRVGRVVTDENAQRPTGDAPVRVHLVRGQHREVLRRYRERAARTGLAGQEADAVRSRRPTGLVGHLVDELVAAPTHQPFQAARVEFGRQPNPSSRAGERIVGHRFEGQPNPAPPRLVVDDHDPGRRAH